MTERREKSTEKVTTEIERKFLVSGIDLADIPGMKEAKATKIDQGYLEVTDKEAVRIRRKGEEYFMTYKGAPEGHSAERTEIEFPLSRELFEKLWPLTEGRRLEKTRYEIPFGDHMIELDVFEGANAGNMMAEVEFKSTAGADIFRPPVWFGPDVTADKRFGNASIAEFGFPKLAA